MWILGLKRLTLENLYTLDLVIFSLICHKILNKEKNQLSRERNITQGFLKFIICFIRHDYTSCVNLTSAKLSVVFRN